MKTSTVFIAAKAKLAHEHRHCICYAIAEATYGKRGAEAAGQRASTIIADRIKPFTMAPHWLAAKMTGVTGPDGHSYVKRRMWIERQGPVAIQAWRHAWLDQLIAEFKAKGD